MVSLLNIVFRDGTWSLSGILYSGMIHGLSPEYCIPGLYMVSLWNIVFRDGTWSLYGILYSEMVHGLSPEYCIPGWYMISLRNIVFRDGTWFLSGILFSGMVHGLSPEYCIPGWYLVSLRNIVFRNGTWSLSGILYSGIRNSSDAKLQWFYLNPLDYDTWYSIGTSSMFIYKTVYKKLKFTENRIEKWEFNTVRNICNTTILVDVSDKLYTVR